MLLLVSYRPLARDFLKRGSPGSRNPGDGISSNWLIAELTHHLPDRSDPHLGGRLARLPRTVNGTGHTGPMTCAIRPPSLTVTFQFLANGVDPVFERRHAAYADVTLAYSAPSRRRGLSDVSDVVRAYND